MFFRQNSVKLSLFLIIGILLGYFLDTTPAIPFRCAIFSIILLGIIFYRTGKSHSFSFGILVACTTLSIGFLAVTLAQHKNHADHYSKNKSSGPHLYHLQIKEVLKSNTFSDNYIASVLEVDQKKSGGRILLSSKTDSLGKKLIPDQQIVFYGSYAQISKPLNPHQFSYKQYLNTLGVYHRIQLEPHLYEIGDNSISTSYGWAFKIRENIIGQLKKAKIGQEELSIIQALLLGQRTDISKDTYANYVNAGAIHILAVSGLHIGILLLILQYVLAPLRRLKHGQTIQLAIIIVLLWSYAFLAGLSASIVRAVSMFSFLAYAMFLNRPTNTFNILALSLFFILLIEPMFLFQVGFQMSYTAVFAILWIYPMLQNLWSPNNLLLKKTWQLTSVSIAAQIGVLPIALFYFHQFPGLFFISNLAIIPFLGIILGLGILVIIFAVTDNLPSSIAAIYNEMISGMNLIVGWVGKQESFIFRNISFDQAQVLLGYALLASVLVFFSKRSPKRLFISLALVMCFQLYLLYANYAGQRKEEIIVLHQAKNTVLFHRLGNKLSISSTNNTQVATLQEDYSTAERIENVNLVPLQNAYNIQGQHLYILDSLAIYPPNGYQTDLILITQSPKLNLTRFIDSLKPKQIIADGSNYRSDVLRWQRTCEQKKVPFHYTGEKGAFYFNVKY
ncbi:competence protein [Sediminicola sp. YIK13]|uniref:ComEC/Rec2 family competence protein n=1 Tax=Sediminicola sp. YIK13 TaxID=1453352 RepID=UPI0007205D33|nr:ComEC/Rec2 family competence protein [Sediminicola sp. YIK13]ALM08044.1 competence protein [Sediminicola sp. YIK13]